MESDAVAVPGYVNRPTGHMPEQRSIPAPATIAGGRRQALRIALVALRAYEQRAERQARLRRWLMARAAPPAM